MLDWNTYIHSVIFGINVDFSKSVEIYNKNLELCVDVIRKLQKEKIHVVQYNKTSEKEKVFTEVSVLCWKKMSPDIKLSFEKMFPDGLHFNYTFHNLWMNITEISCVAFGDEFKEEKTH